MEHPAASPTVHPPSDAVPHGTAHRTAVGSSSPPVRSAPATSATDHPSLDAESTRLAREAAALAETESDGRRLRRQRNRDAVVDALLSLYREGNLDPSAEDVAQRSGVSARSVFRYFDDVRDLARAALERAMLDVAHLIPVDARPDDPTAVKVEALLDERQRLWEENASVLMVVRVRAPFQPTLAESMATSRMMFRQQVADLFAPELERVRDAEGDAAAEHLATALHLLCTFEAWRILRVDQGMSLDAARSSVSSSLFRLLRDS